jgi:hypothetical protein
MAPELSPGGNRVIPPPIRVHGIAVGQASAASKQVRAFGMTSNGGACVTTADYSVVKDPMNQRPPVKP